MNITQEEQADQLVEDFESFDDWEDRYRLLIDLGRKLPPLDETERNEENRVHGCQSNVWLAAKVDREGGKNAVEFRADSDSSIVRGLIAILRKVYSGRPAEQILTYDVEGLFERLGLNQHLSLGRRNGLYSMVERIKALAESVASNMTRAHG